VDVSGSSGAMIRFGFVLGMSVLLMTVALCDRSARARSARRQIAADPRHINPRNQ
jgi:hypothetical protein